MRSLPVRDDSRVFAKSLMTVDLQHERIYRSRVDRVYSKSSHEKVSLHTYLVKNSKLKF